MKIRPYSQSDQEPWDSYVHSHSDGTHCHLSGWKKVIENAYGHKGYYVLAEDNFKIVGILPLLHIKSFIFGSQLTSMPFLNYGGIIADDEEVEIVLLRKAIELSQELKVNHIELRHLKAISFLGPADSANPGALDNSVQSIGQTHYVTKTHKVRMLLNLPASKDALYKSFKSKLRSQISRPQKEGMTAIIGGPELIDQFYRVFSISMRDLGSPVHSKKLFRQICNEFPQNLKVGIVHYQEMAVAGGLLFCFRDTVEIPWASSLRKFKKFSPNMLLYWSLMEYACSRGFEYFDFGRSTPEEGTYKFKEQWGAKPMPLYWHYIVYDGRPAIDNDSQKSKFETLIRYWKKLPVPVSNIMGPLIRKRISL